MNSPFDLGLYTSEYTQPDSPAKNFRDGDAAWTRFLAARPLLYLPNRSPNNDEDPINRQRRLWTYQELQSFGDTVEERTHAQLLLQERTLRRWHQSATDIQRCFRGMHARLYVLQLRRELFEHTLTLKRAIEFSCEQRRQRKAATAIQRRYRCHRKWEICRLRGAITLQRAIRRFIHRLKHRKALLTIQRVARCFLWRLRWQRYRQQVRKMLIAAARQRQLVLATNVFQRVREKILLQRQVDAWTSHPERMQTLLRARRRKQKVQASLIPSLQGTANRSKVTESIQHYSARLDG
ncbi:uncharacterized protein PITG_00445 [Phytophthora infestans T30-4]|uniref:Uncharacterized protein n=1 Tax=Phytophthora infestans (strain T30-4) TaxID=403677 RepID=D0MQT9_PHYIT|nr:uncharacterized protein PITG_00445 [Phytophthora infestans T30-4]EEY57858.1 hypothetical protein PITG_00445 [Phytophthora infestans T30-4]|eukprot:XP_002909044.1 hypothetical protein PITG_00445 [Phytophthora infestans T30-4]